LFSTASALSYYLLSINLEKLIWKAWKQVLLEIEDDEK
jgi:hypothetical protein